MLGFGHLVLLDEAPALVDEPLIQSPPDDRRQDQGDQQLNEGKASLTGMPALANGL
jgi:hypothetical protein